jgi:hypothetical protein
VGAVVLGVDVVVGLVDVLDCVLAAAFAATVCAVGAADALAIPAAAPPVASAPATIVAPSILEMVMWVGPPGVGWGGVAIVGDVAKRQCRCA